MASSATRQRSTEPRQQAAEPQPEVVYADAPAPAPAAGGMSPDAIQQLKDLAALKDQGILTEDEFAAQKAKILAS